MYINKKNIEKVVEDRERWKDIHTQYTNLPTKHIIQSTN